ncbi:terminase family protein [Novosphingobium sp.]|uniref:DNA-packaging protein n=1 Tax=Novosphingobium sp. TaxID=1874826 RepID=UPI0025E240D8|nr:terminase family protein [Novosphingobium sp.]MCC6926124.1 DNA-packaging protein [Novosphingobium sp.]
MNERTRKRLKALLALEPVERREMFERLSESQRRPLRHSWQLFAHDGQLAPEGDWLIWLILAGRGFGKTRAGAEWVRALAESDPQVRIALVGASLGEARAVMVEGESGLLAIAPRGKRPKYEPSKRQLQWPNGARATLYSAGEPESLRGPQHSHAWCDEIAKWDGAGGKALSAWDNLLLGLRLGERPQVVATTTPRAVPLLTRLIDHPEAEQTRGRTIDNGANLPPRFIRAMKREFGRTALGRQELYGELLDDIEGALWTRALLEHCRDAAGPGTPIRTVIGVDPPASAAGDACGIVVCALYEDGLVRVLADCSIERPSPESWARRVAQAAQSWEAERVVAEANQGGDMVAAVLRAADVALPLKLVHARHGKTARAEPVAALYEVGRVRHLGTFPKLEDQLCGLMAGGAYQGPGRSPDRADALVWAVTELVLGRRGVPRVRAT